MTYHRNTLTSALGLSLLGLLLVCGTAAMAGSTPPTIGDLDGAVCALKIGGTGFDRTTGARETIQGVVTWTLTEIGPETLRIVEHSGDGDTTKYAHYARGLLTVGQVNDPTLATEATCGYVVVSGTKGKLKLKGQFVTFAGAPAGEAEIGTVSGKQTATK